MEILTVSVKDAVQRTGLSRDVLYSAINDNRLKSTRVGKRRLIDFASLKELVGVGEQANARG
jgi:excisionase family DNA binding protein